MADFTGFNPTDITASIKNMNASYTELSNIINTKTKKFIEDVSMYWACPEAKTYFNGDFKTVTNNLGKTIESNFAMIIDLMNNSVAFQGGLIKEVDVSLIKDNINGDIGINGEKNISLANSFQADLRSTIESILKKCKNISNGFLGGNQKQALDARINTVYNAILSCISDQTSKLVVNVKSTAQKYQSSAGVVSNYFENESGVSTAAGGIGSTIIKN